MTSTGQTRLPGAAGSRGAALILLTALVCGAAAAPAAAQCEVTRLLLPAPGGDPDFGLAVALQDGTAVVGNASYLFGGAPSWVYELLPEGWSQQPSPLAPDGLTQHYSTSVSISGDTIVVSAQDDADADVLAYVFERSGGVWAKSAKLKVAASTYLIGGSVSVAIEGDTVLLAGSFDANAFLFERAGGVWSQTQQLVPTAPGGVVHFGESASLHDGRAIVGGCTADAGLPCVGTAWIFEPQGGNYVQTAQLLPAGGAQGDYAGSVLAQSDDTIVLGAPGHDLGFSGQGIGAAFVFELSGGSWTQTAFLTAPNPKFGDDFGQALALQGDALLIGAPRRDDALLDAGAVYVHHRSGSAWTTTAVLHATEPVLSGRFGRALALDDDTLLVGSPSTASWPEQGAYIVRGAPGLDSWTPVWGAVAGSTGTPCSSGHLTPAVGGDASLSLTGALPFAPAWLVIGLDRINLPFKGGVLVPAPDLLLPFVVDGAGGHAFAWTWPGGLPTGSKLWIQYWIVDLGAPVGLSASNGVGVTLP
jgi:hypothetical protein